MSKRAADHARLLAGIEAQRIVSLKEASRLAGVSVDTLRKHYRNLIVRVGRSESACDWPTCSASVNPSKDFAATSPDLNQQRQSAHFQRTGEVCRRAMGARSITANN